MSNLSMHRALRSEAFKNFSHLPDEARVDQYVVSALYGVSRATVWRRVRAGLIPAPQRVGNTSRWNVGELRKYLTTEAAA